MMVPPLEGAVGGLKHHLHDLTQWQTPVPPLEGAVGGLKRRQRQMGRSGNIVPPLEGAVGGLKQHRAEAGGRSTSRPTARRSGGWVETDLVRQVYEYWQVPPLEG